MDFDGLTSDATKMTANLAAEILAANYSPANKIQLLTVVISRIGRAYATKLGTDVSRVFGSEALKINPDFGSLAQIEDLARKMTREAAFGLPPTELARDYFTNVFARNGEQAYKNAISLDKRPTITRRLTDRDHCDWCAARTGTFSADSFSELPTEIFRRHLGCKCEIRLSGSGGRSRKLNNYVKKG